MYIYVYMYIHDHTHTHIPLKTVVVQHTHTRAFPNQLHHNSCTMKVARAIILGGHHPQLHYGLAARERVPYNRLAYGFVTQRRVPWSAALLVRETRESALVAQESAALRVRSTSPENGFVTQRRAP